MTRSSSLILGVLLALGLVATGGLLGKSLLDMRKLDRTVTVKGLSEREYPSDLSLWPLQFVEAGNDLSALYRRVAQNQQKIVAFLRQAGFEESEISLSAPSIVDKQAQSYGGQQAELRFTATATVTVYTEKVDLVRKSSTRLGDLGEEGIVFSGDDYRARTEYLFTRLNEVKPGMIEEATKKAREVAQKFAQDSDSRLGKIKTAWQGQFSITERDGNTPHIKKVRVVTTVEYYLVD